MSEREPKVFDRLLEILLPAGGYVMALFEGYFDESGGFDTHEGILCISGYLYETSMAKSATTDWSAELAKDSLPYFHMVDCAHGSDLYSGISKDRRVEIAKTLIANIKANSIWGVSIMARKALYDKSEDPYVHLANCCVDLLRFKLNELGLQGDIAYFFEAGHASGPSAYQSLARKLGENGATVTFARKTQVPLLQAADILAWQSVKYIKDFQSKERPPRKDFLSLMEHRHTFFLISSSEQDKSYLMMTAEWPEHLRPAKDEVHLFRGNRHLHIGAAYTPTFRLLPIWRGTAVQSRD